MNQLDSTGSHEMCPRNPDSPKTKATAIPAKPGIQMKGRLDNISHYPLYRRVVIRSNEYSGTVNRRGIYPQFRPAYCIAWSMMSMPTASLHAARSCVVIGPGFPSPTARLSMYVTGRTQNGVLVKNASSAV